jgi:hypothetical protein
MCRVGYSMTRADREGLIVDEVIDAVRSEYQNVYRLLNASESMAGSLGELG